MVETSASLPLDPSPAEWLTNDRCLLLSSDLSSTAEFLALSGLLNRSLQYWLRLQLALEVAGDEMLWPSAERETQLDLLESDWRSKNDAVALGLSERQVRLKLMVKPGCLRWARWQWQNRLENLFLARKSQLDKASCRLLRLDDKHLALELYHRVLAKEATFESIASQYGQGAERLQSGLLPLQPTANMPMGLGPLLERLSPGELSKPVRLGKGVALVELECLEPATLCSQTEEVLLAHELGKWLQGMQPHLTSHLKLSDH